MARLEKTFDNPSGARKLLLDASDPAFVALVALAPRFSLSELKGALKTARVGSIDAQSVVSQAASAGLVLQEGLVVEWDLPRLHQASLAVVGHPLLPTLCGVAELKGYFLPFDLRFRLARWAFYLNDIQLLRRTGFEIGPLLPFFLSCSPEWVASRQPELASMLDTHLGLNLVYLADLSAEWQERLTRIGPFGFLIGLMRGDSKPGSDSAQGVGFSEALLFAEGRVEEAHQAFQKLIKRRKKGPVLHPLAAPFAQLAALRCGDALAASDERCSCPWFPELQQLLWLAADQMVAPQKDRVPQPESGISLRLLFLHILKPLFPGLRLNQATLEAALKRWSQQGLMGLVRQLEPATTPQHWGHGLGQRSDWELWLSALRTRGQASQPAAGKTAKAAVSYRMAWHLDEGTPLPVKEKQLRDGWSASSITWRTLMNKPPDFLTEQERVVLGKVRRYKDSWGEHFAFGVEAFRALVGHPNLYYKGKPCRLETVPLQLKVFRHGKNLRVETVPELQPGREFAVFPVDSACMGLCEVTPAQQALLALTQQAVAIPLEAKEQLLDSLSPWMDKVEIALASDLVAEQEGDSLPLVRLQPLGEGLHFEVGVRPAGPDGPFFTPGRGTPTFNLKVNSSSHFYRRNLEREALENQKLWQDCSALQNQTSLDLPDLEEALELLLQLQECKVRLEWPAKKSWSLKALQRKQGLSLKALQDGEWFEIRGQVKVDESLQLEVQRLLELARNARGRFIQLEPGQFLALTSEMKQRLSALDDLVEVHKKKVRLSRLAVTTLAELGVEGDEAFAQTLEQFQQAESYNARIPGALQAELRDYQIEGYRWMARRAKAGAGCCLADDMGLGKTMQALALLVKEARQGPHLVVCPTSVCGNWVSQIERFAPTLQVVSLEGKQRSQQLDKLEGGCVALCSYRILMQDIDLLQKVAWNVVVLDEAQFIKNPHSKTARAAFCLPARTRLATTGTPIENRLLELWSIFHFLNPGLLGSLTSFQRRFETPALSGQASPRQRLRRLVAPFLLRRTKSQVLAELPARTDISLEVELSPKERALYEHLRQQAMDSAQEEQGHLQLLAHLTRLRQACCHPQLVQPEALGSAKFETFFELAEELRDGRHRALVFSQFVELLQLLRKELDERGWSYLYLDGSTPAAQRPQLVDQFQEGETDLFLISLKAGGTGLNLTAADYVVHLDPWWNPAAEDQASDRAHRIGQTRPVTVYRLVAKDTLEERVLQLHTHKRELAQQVLEGRESEVRLNARELMELLRES